MRAKTLERMRAAVLRGDYYLTFHAEEELAEDGLTVYDVESIILSGEIVVCQRDNTGLKYVIIGTTTANDTATVVAKFVGDVVIVTVFLGMP